jgi:hypothetical protein
MIHFWREVSLAGMPRASKAMDQCYALLFESAFELAEADPNWALECLASESIPELPMEPLTHLAWHAGCSNITHLQLSRAFTQLYAPRREADPKWQNDVYVAFCGELWFCVAILLAAGIDENHRLWLFRFAALGVTTFRGGVGVPFFRSNVKVIPPDLPRSSQAA